MMSEDTFELDPLPEVSDVLSELLKSSSNAYYTKDAQLLTDVDLNGLLKRLPQADMSTGDPLQVASGNYIEDISFLRSQTASSLTSDMIDSIGPATDAMAQMSSKDVNILQNSVNNFNVADNLRLQSQLTPSQAEKKKQFSSLSEDDMLFQDLFSHPLNARSLSVSQIHRPPQDFASRYATDSLQVGLTQLQTSIQEVGNTTIRQVNTTKPTRARKRRSKKQQHGLYQYCDSVFAQILTPLDREMIKNGVAPSGGTGKNKRKNEEKKKVKDADIKKQRNVGEPLNQNCERSDSSSSGSSFSRESNSIWDESIDYNKGASTEGSISSDSIEDALSDLTHLTAAEINAASKYSKSDKSSEDNSEVYEDLVSKIPTNDPRYWPIEHAHESFSANEPNCWQISNDSFISEAI
ncbi:hypothetical protein V1511DRAFT_508894 [Dipodascopsis uninucleata]